jgi:hypothetical protein
MTGKRAATLEEYLLGRRRVDPVTGCWEWTLSLTSGYGYFIWQGVWTYAHRAAWLLWKGPIPEGHDVLHHCDNGRCFNPEHLWTGTQQDNLDDMVKKGRHVSNSEALKRAHKEGRMKTAINPYRGDDGRYTSKRKA